MNPTEDVTSEQATPLLSSPQIDPPPSDAPPAPGGKVRAVVAAHIEPVTRFDDKDLNASAPEEELAIALELTLTQQVNFETTQFQGPGHLPRYSDKLANASSFSSDLHQRLVRAQSGAPKAIAQWAAANAGAYLHRLPASAAFLTAPGSVGYEHTCYACSGACKVTCMACSGQGRTNCMVCYGSGKLNCSSCHGLKQLGCTACSGRGSWTDYIPQQYWDSSTNSYIHSTRTEFKTCMSCSGAGKQTCYACDYAGKVQCNGCHGSGKINCIPCGTTGKVNCGDCNATGVQHVSGTVRASVATDETLSIASQDKTLEGLVRDWIALADLPGYGALLAVDYKIDGSVLETAHRLRLDVRRAGIQAADRNFTIYGFGPAPTVFNFENIAGHMLTDDLTTLEKQVAGAARWRRQRGTDLLDTTADFLRSELNMLIAEKVADSKSTPQEAAEQVQNHFHGLVESSYVDRATNALRGALARLYGSELTEPAAYLCALIALISGVMFVFEWPAPSPWIIGMTTIGSAAAVWFVLEWMTRRRIAARFEADFSRRVLGQLSANGSVKRWRIGMGIGATLSVILAIYITQQIPFVRNLHAEKREMTGATQILERWFFQPSPDWRQRTYPSRKMLEAQAEAGVWRAQIILGWQLLLGADGTAKDVERAGYWFDKAEAETHKSAAWKAAKAIQTLHQEATPEDLRAASSKLKEAADTANFIEARYWEARTYLDSRSPVYDLNRGIQALTQAANKNHAHAEMLLGEHYASGQGVKRDLNTARRYLQRAASAGVARANEVLATL
jgi:hypothetical protein